MLAVAQSIRPYVDRQLGGTLASRLEQLRSEGQSYASIARWLDREHGITVTAEAVRQWCKQMGVAS